MAVIIAVAALVIAAWAPSRDRRQLRLVPRLTARTPTTTQAGTARRSQLRNWATRCASITIVACGPRLVIAGRTEPSTTHNPSTPRTRHW